MTMEEAKTLFDYDEWATNRTLETVSTLSEEDYRRDLKSSHGGIHGTLVHMLFAGQIWLDRWNKKTTGAFPSAESIASLSDLKQRWADYRRALQSFLQTLDEASLHAPFTYNDTKGVPHTQTLDQLFTHAVNHSSYHRGQVVTMIRQVGARPQNTDFVAYVRKQKQ